LWVIGCSAVISLKPHGTLSPLAYRPPFFDKHRGIVGGKVQRGDATAE